MAQIKPIDRISAKWLRQSQSATVEYEEGVRNPRRSWAQATAQAESAYEQGVQAAIARKAFSSGVRAAGDSKWQENAIAKGPARFASGVAIAETSYQKGFEPYRAVIEKTTLPARGAKGDPKNIDRVRVMAKALHDAKLARGGA